MTQKEINELKARVYSISNCMFPLDVFLNDIEQNKNQNYDKEGVYNDLKLITDAVYELKEKLKEKEQDYTLEQVKKMWEEKGWKWKERDDYHNGKDYRLYFVTKNEYSVYQPRIFFRKYDNTYYAFEGYDTTDFEGYPITEIRVLHITLDLQSLITKTIKALEKEEKHDYS